MTIDSEQQHFFAVVPAAGAGQRMHCEHPKQYLLLHGKTVLEHTLEKLLQVKELQRIIVPVSATDNAWRHLNIIKDNRINVIEGGQSRCQSVLNGLMALSSDCVATDWILVHDVARPCVALTDVHKLIEQLSHDAVGGILAVPVVDTLKHVDNQQKITRTIDRSVLWHAQTPQMFRYQLLLDALKNGISQGLTITDEASAIEAAGHSAKVVQGSRTNIKLTRPEDLSLAQFYLSESAR